MRIIHSYLLKEFFSAFFLSLFVLTFVMIMGNIIYLVALIVSKGVSIFIILKLLLFSLPYSIPFILPIAVMAGLLLSLGRLSSDNEIISIRASGMSTPKTMFPFLILGVIFTLSSVILNNRIIADSHLKRRQVMKEIGAKNPAAVLEPGIFINAFDKYIIFVYEVEGNKFRNIRIYEPLGENKPPRTIIAKRGEFITLSDKNILKLKLIDGTSDEINPNDPSSFYKINFHTYFMNLDFAKGESKDALNKKTKDMSLKELWSQIQELRRLQINADPVSTELHKRITLSFSSLIFFLVGVPLGIISRRKEKAANIALAFLIVGIYFILSLGVEALSSQGNLAPSSGMWIPNIVFGLLGVILLLKLCVF